MNIAVVLFAYQRPEYLKRALKSHTKIEADYFAFIDYSEMQDEIYELIADSGKYDSIICRPTKFGLDKNIIEGIKTIFKMDYDALIVLEDDLLISYNAIQYLHYQLWKLRDYKHFSSVCLDKGEIFNVFRCWGWGTWKDRWQDVVGKIDVNADWAIQLHRIWKEEKLYCYASPIKRVKHIGNKGTHYKWYSKFGCRQYIRKVKEFIKKRRNKCWE